MPDKLLFWSPAYFSDYAHTEQKNGEPIDSVSEQDKLSTWLMRRAGPEEGRWTTPRDMEGRVGVMESDGLTLHICTTTETELRNGGGSAWYTRYVEVILPDGYGVPATLMGALQVHGYQTDGEVQTVP